LPLVSTPAIEEFANHLRAGSCLVIAGSKHEILREQDHYRSQFWAAFDAFVPGTSCSDDGMSARDWEPTWNASRVLTQSGSGNGVYVRFIVTNGRRSTKGTT
jgi:hypothetical protein